MSAGRPIAALRNVTLDILPGEFLTLVGASGCGKSTLLNILAGLEKAEDGVVNLDGARVSGPGPDRSVVFQDGALFPWLDVVRNVEFGLRSLKLPKDQCRERATRYLEIVQLERFAHSNVHELSGGMRQRVAIARALAVEPRVLLMDEPFSALDAITREDLYVQVQSIWERTKATVVMVTHNVREAVTIADRVVLLRRLAMDSIKPSIQAEWPVKLPRPRHIDDVEVVKIAKEISAAMREEMFDDDLPAKQGGEGA